MRITAAGIAEVRDAVGERAPVGLDRDESEQRRGVGPPRRVGPVGGHQQHRETGPRSRRLRPGGGEGRLRHARQRRRDTETPAKSPRGRPCRPLSSRPLRPPSSRGLGRRPLTAETGVRIPVAVPPEPAPRAGLRPVHPPLGKLLGKRLPPHRSRPVTALAEAPNQPQNPFLDAEPWRMDRVAEAVDQAVDETTEGLTDFDRRVYAAIAAYAFDEATCHPSQEQIAGDLGCWRESVNRSVRRLREAGWLRIVERRWSRGSRWWHNVYELLAAYAVSVLTLKRITRRAHRRARRVGFGRTDHTRWGGGRQGGRRWCSCGHCKPDRTSVRTASAPDTGSIACREAGQADGRQVRRALAGLGAARRRAVHGRGEGQPMTGEVERWQQAEDHRDRHQAQLDRLDALEHARPARRGRPRAARRGDRGRRRRDRGRRNRLLPRARG